MYAWFTQNDGNAPMSKIGQVMHRLANTRSVIDRYGIKLGGQFAVQQYNGKRGFR